MRLHDLCAIGIVLAAAVVPQSSRALTVTLAECHEGADFIRNAALSRDNGIRADEFLGRMEQDFVMIRSVPPELRWFARDEDDERLLRMAAQQVFVDPREADAHHRSFLAECRATVLADTGDSPRVATR
jgi:hypothetical protein